LLLDEEEDDDELPELPELFGLEEELFELFELLLPKISLRILPAFSLLLVLLRGDE
jgi:hypothetical protein